MVSISSTPNAWNNPPLENPQASPLQACESVQLPEHWRGVHEFPAGSHPLVWQPLGPPAPAWQPPPQTVTRPPPPPPGILSMYACVVMTTVPVPLSIFRTEDWPAGSRLSARFQKSAASFSESIRTSGVCPVRQPTPKMAADTTTTAARLRPLNIFHLLGCPLTSLGFAMLPVRGVAEFKLPEGPHAARVLDSL